LEQLGKETPVTHINNHTHHSLLKMDTDALKKNFVEQLEQADKQIAELETNLVKAREYKLKLQGGLETLELLNPSEEESAETAPTEVAE